MSVHYDFVHIVGSISEIIPLINHMLCSLCAKIYKKKKWKWLHILGILSVFSIGNIDGKFRKFSSEYVVRRKIDVRTGLFGECWEVPSDSLLSGFNGLMVILTLNTARL